MITEEMQEEVKEILLDAEKGINKDSIAAIMCLNKEIDSWGSVIDAILAGVIWAEYNGDNDSEWDVDKFTYHLTEICPRNEDDIFKLKGSENTNIKISIENIEHKLPCLFSLQSFIEAGMTDYDAIELFNKYFPEAGITIEDCNFFREKNFQNFDQAAEKELEEKSKEIVQIMTKNWKNKNQNNQIFHKLFLNSGENFA